MAKKKVLDAPDTATDTVEPPAPVALDVLRGVFPPKPEETPVQTFRREFAEYQQASAHNVVSPDETRRLLNMAASLIPAE